MQHRMFAILGGHPRFPATSDSLRIVDDVGRVRRVQLDVEARNKPGSTAECGYRVTSQPVAVPLDRQTPDGLWWMRIGYISSANDHIMIKIGGSSTTAVVHLGLGELWVHTGGRIDQVTLQLANASSSLCTDEITIGTAFPDEVSPP
jgi:hypothetical protein